MPSPASPSRPPARLLPIALVVLVVLLGGCRLDVATTIDLDGDGGGRLTLSLRADAALEQAAEGAGVDPLGRMVERVRAVDGWRVDDAGRGEDGSRVVELTTTFPDPAAFAARWTELTAALDAPEGRLLGPMAVELDEEADTVAVRGAIELTVTDVAAADAGLDLAVLQGQLAEAVGLTLAVRTPGTPLEADGVVVHDDAEAAEGPAVVTWTASPGATVPVGLVAERGGGSWLQLALLGGAAVLALLLVGAGVAAQRRTARRQPAGRR